MKLSKFILCLILYFILRDHIEFEHAVLIIGISILFSLQYVSNQIRDITIFLIDKKLREKNRAFQGEIENVVFKNTFYVIFERR